MMQRKKIGWIVLAVLVFGTLFVIVTMSLWNWLVPTLFSGPEISFLQTIGLLILAKIIFGFGKSSSWKSHYRKKGHSMSAYEKEMLKRKFMERCGWDRQSGSTPASDSDERKEQPSDG